MKIKLITFAVMFVALSATALAQQAVLPDEYIAGPSQFALTVNTDPADAKVKILNIGPAYHDGILLEPGRYHLEASKPGYSTEHKWVEITDRSLSVSMKLVSKPAATTVAFQAGVWPERAQSRYQELRLKADRILKPGDDLRKAVSNAAPGALLVLDPGTYKVTGKWDLKKSIHLVGSGPDQVKVLMEELNILGVTKQVRFEGIGFTCLGIVETTTIYSRGTNLNMENCRIEKSHGGYAGLEIKGGTVKTTHCEFINNSGTGVFIREGASGILRNNLSKGNEIAGISVKDNADPLVEENRFVNNDGAGIYVYSSGKGTFRNNLSEGNEMAGIEVKDKATPLVEDNRFLNNTGSGMYVHSSGKGTYRNNLSEGNQGVGIRVKENAAPLVEGNRLVNNKGSGIFVHSSGKGTFRDNLSGEGTHVSLAIEVKESPDAVFSGNRVDGKVKGVSSY